MLRTPIKLLSASAFLITVLAVACATAPEQTALQKYDPLIRAGFDFKEAETPRHLEIIRSVPSQQVVPYTYDKKLYYIYVIKECPCAYVGNEENYKRLRENLPESQTDKHKVIGYSSNLYLFATGIDNDTARFLEEPLP